MIRLTVCIPTYNFGKFIGQTLDSILPQISEEVEVIILDGGSTDDTAEIVNIKQKIYPQLKYIHQNFRGGIDRDIEKVVGLAKGIYCWLFSADDIMLPGSIHHILNAIESNNDVYLCEHVLCDFAMNPIREYPPFNKVTTPKLFDLAKNSQKYEYFRSARTSEAFFSFMSSPIFKKQVWDAAIIPESFRNTCWIVAGHLLSMVSQGITISYLNKVLLHKRGGNDSFADKGIVNRCRIAIEAFQHVGNTIFEEKSEYAFHIRRVLQLDIPFHYLLLAKFKACLNPEVEDIQVLNRIAKIHYSDFGLNWMKYALYVAAHPLLITTAYRVKKTLQSKLT